MIVFSYYPQDPRVRREAEALNRLGIYVDIICLRHSEESSNEENGFIKIYRVMKGTDKKETIIKYLLLTSMFFFISSLRLQCLQAVRKYDLIQFHNMPDYLVFSACIQKILSVPVILDLHDLSVELFKTRWRGFKASLLLPLVKYIEKFSCRFCNSLITTSNGFKKRLVQRSVPAGKITVVLNSADEKIFQFDNSRDFPVITKDAKLLYHGTVAHRFGLHVAVQALGILQGRIPGIKLSIYGRFDPSYREELQQQIKQLKLEDTINMDGWRSQEEIYRVIKDSDIALVPYLDDDFMNLALSTKTFEYAASGIPVVASRLDSIESIFNDASIGYATAGHAEEMAKTIEEFCLKPSIRKEKTIRAFKAIQAVSGEVMAKRYTDLIIRVIDNRYKQV